MWVSVGGCVCGWVGVSVGGWVCLWVGGCVCGCLCGCLCLWVSVWVSVSVWWWGAGGGTERAGCLVRRVTERGTEGDVWGVGGGGVVVGGRVPR